MKKIAIFQYDLGVGGIQKSLINLLNVLDPTIFDIDLFLFTKENFYNASFSKNVHVHYIKPFFRIAQFIPFTFLYKVKKTGLKNENQYDLAIDFNSYKPETAFYALHTNAKKKIIWCHNDIEKKLKEDFKYKILWLFFKKKYDFFDCICAVSKGAKYGLLNTININQNEVLVIPNIINTHEILTKANENIVFSIDKNKYNLVTMGRITHQKGFDILLEYMGKICVKRQDIHLYIIGDGEDLPKLKRYVNKHKLHDYVTFLGQQANPFPYLSLMDGFVLTSRYEGQGMVLLEAKCLGLKLFISKHLENYVEGIEGSYNLVNDLLSAKKEVKKINTLDEYNRKIIQSIYFLCE